MERKQDNDGQSQLGTVTIIVERRGVNYVRHGYLTWSEQFFKTIPLVKYLNLDFNQDQLDKLEL